MVVLFSVNGSVVDILSPVSAAGLTEIRITDFIPSCQFARELG